MLLRHARASVTLLITVAAALGLAIAFAAPARAESFADTAGSSVEEAVDALASEGVVAGCRDGEFCPWEPLTRGQMATVLTNALELPVAEANYFADLAGSVHADNINALAEAGVTQGCDEGKYCPQEALSRGQMASMLAEAFGLDATEEIFFDDAGETHGSAVHRLAAAGIAAGCGEPLTAFCPNVPVLRAQSAWFLARTMDLVDRVELAPLEERRVEQEELDAEQEQLREAEEAAEAERQAQAEADATTDRDKIWDDLARCESGYGGEPNWSLNTGNGYYGGLQFALSSWRWVGGSGYPHQASRAEQIHRGELLLAKQGWGAWPYCSSKLGYR